LIGAPPGYVGYEEGGYLTEAIRRRPYSVILFDEIEKAHPDVFNVLLQVLDDGRLTDSQGRTVDFRNTVVVMTSNLGSHFIQEMGGKESYAQVKQQVMNLVGKHFRPEFINRIDECVVFHALNSEQIKQIAKIQINLLQSRLSSQDIHLDVNQALLDYIAEIGFDPVYGARPLKRVLEHRLVNPLAQELLSGHIPPHSTIHPELKGENINFKISQN
jgi:ATP-dependent Clp protease ATP-binding subunit ClpB